MIFGSGGAEHFGPSAFRGIICHGFLQCITTDFKLHNGYRSKTDKIMISITICRYSVPRKWILHPRW